MLHGVFAHGEFLPHGVCLLWNQWLVLTRVVADSVIALAYYSIPVALVYFISKRRDLAFRWMFLLFGVFIFLCGTTHAMEVWTLWHPDYWLEANVKAITAVASAMTAALLWPMIPAALALPSPADLTAKNRELTREIGTRKEAEAALRAAQAELENRVRERTSELSCANVALQQEIAERKRIDEERNQLLAREKQAEEALRMVQMELAQVMRAATVGEMAASIAHEVSQPLAAVVTNGQACLRWLARESPDLHEALAATNRIIRDATRASDIVQRIRALIKQAEVEKLALDINEVILEVVGITQGAILRNGVSLRTRLGEGLPTVRGDRIQLQQVMFNLMMNAVDAMSGVEGQVRELVLMSELDDSGAVRVTARDSGRGVDPKNLERMFEAFFTTKPDGLGMGLSISRSIIAAHGGWLWASVDDGPGVSVHFTVPTTGGGEA